MLVLIAASFHVAAAAQGVPATGFPSKDNAQAWFSMSLQQWQERVRRTVAAGAASVLDAEETGVAMVTRTDAGEVLVIRPLYLSGPKKPDAVHVSSSYRGEGATRLTEVVLQEILRAARQRLLPEFELNDSVDRGERRLFVVLEVLEAEPD